MKTTLLLILVLLISSCATAPDKITANSPISARDVKEDKNCKTIYEIREEVNYNLNNVTDKYEKRYKINQGCNILIGIGFFVPYGIFGIISGTVCAVQTSANDGTVNTIARLKGEKQVYDSAYTDKCYEWNKTHFFQGNLTRYDNNQTL